MQYSIHSTKTHLFSVHSVYLVKSVCRTVSTQVHSAKVHSLDVTLHSTQVNSPPTVPHVVALDQYIGSWTVVVHGLSHQPVPLGACKWKLHFRSQLYWWQTNASFFLN